MDGAKLADKDGMGRDNDKVGAVSCVDGAKGTESGLSDAAGSETRICAEDGEANDTATASAAIRRIPFTMPQV